MDEIFDRLKAVKIPRKYLVVGLILSEILGILVLIWFLRSPLTQKFLLTPPKAYSVVSMDPKKQYLVKQGDSLTGKAIPNTKVIILLTPTNKKTILRSTADGTWYYQIPNNLNIQKYHFSVINFDKNNKLAFLKTYRFRVETNSRLNPFLKRFQEMMPKALAQESEESFSIDFGEKFGYWVQGLNSQDIYVYCETNGENSYCQDGADVFLTDYDGILSRCNSLGQQCIIGHRPAKDLIKISQNSSRDFVDRLIQKIDENNYNITVLLDYFPEIVNDDAFEKIRKQQKKGGSYKNDISETELANLIQSVVNDLGWENAKYEENFGDPVKTLLTLSDPILGTKAVVKYFEKGGFDRLTIDEQTDFLVAVAFLPIPAKAGKAFLGLASTEDLVRSGGLIRRQIAEGSAVPLRGYWDNLPAFTRYVSPPRFAITAGGYSGPVLPEAYQYFQVIKPYIFTEAWQIEPALTQSVAGKITDLLINIQRVSGKRFEISAQAADAIVQSRVYVVNDDLFLIMVDNSSIYGFTIGDMIVLRRSFYEASDLEMLQKIAHEMVHLIGARTLNDSNTKGFVYKGSTERDRVFTGFYELMTDMIADLSVDSYNSTAFTLGDIVRHGSGYPDLYPDIYEAFYNRLINLNRKSAYDFIEFAITGDAYNLARNVSLYPEFTEFIYQNRLTNLSLDEQFIKFIKNDRGINPNGVSYLGGMGLGVFIYPAVVFNDFFTDIKNGSGINNYSIQIVSAFINEQTINITSAISQNGEALENTSLITRWYIEDVYQNRTFLEQKSESCALGCEITLPTGLNGSYSLIVELTDSNTEEVLASTSTPIEIFQNQSVESAPLAASETEAAPLSSSLSCSYTEWSDVEPYFCQDGFACYYDWYLDEGTSCQPASREPHYHCVPDTLCANSTQGDATRPGD